MKHLESVAIAIEWLSAFDMQQDCERSVVDALLDFSGRADNLALTVGRGFELHEFA